MIRKWGKSSDKNMKAWRASPQIAQVRVSGRGTVSAKSWERHLLSGFNISRAVQCDWSGVRKKMSSERHWFGEGRCSRLYRILQVIKITRASLSLNGKRSSVISRVVTYEHPLCANVDTGDWAWNEAVKTCVPMELLFLCVELLAPRQAHSYLLLNTLVSADTSLP